MKISYLKNSKDQKSDLVLIYSFQDEIKKSFSVLPQDMVESIENKLPKDDWSGKLGESVYLLTGSKKYPRVALFGLGQKRKLSSRELRNFAGNGIIFASQKKASTVLFVLPQFVDDQDVEQSFQSVAYGALMANYAFDDFKSAADKNFLIKNLLLSPLGKVSEKTVSKALGFATAASEGALLTRRLANTPPNHMSPAILALAALALGREFKKLKVKILEKKQIEKLGMGCFLGVASGSTRPPKFIIMEYFGASAKIKPTVLVGKGITFDSGGLSLKPADAMSDMKFDMIGASTVLGTMRAAVDLGLPVNLVGLIPACENMPSGHAYRPDDILTAMNGKTVEILNTDAEGRLILADALCYAKKYNPSTVIDLATLTGACLVALGNERSGLFTPEDDLNEKLIKASQLAGEQLWRLPLGEEYSEAMKSEVADLKNLGGVGGNPRFAGASTGAAFLQAFTDYPWAHIDLACSYYGGKGRSHIRGGANGFGVLTLLEFLRSV